MTFIDITHSDLRTRFNFVKGEGGQWYSPNEDSDYHVHLMGRNRSPGYDPVKNPNPPEVLTVQRIELKVSEKHRSFGTIQPDGRFLFTLPTHWGVVNRRKAVDLMKLVPPQLMLVEEP